MSATAKTKVGRASHTLIESARDYTITNVIQAVTSGKLKLEQQQVQFLQSILNQTIEAGYHRAFNAFMKEVDAAFADVASDAVALAESKKK